MRWIARIFVVLLTAVAMPQVSIAGGELAGSEWGLPQGGDMFIQFKAGGELSGFAGCNTFGGRYEDKRYALTIGPLHVTRKACAADIMAREHSVLTALEATRQVSGDHFHLQLSDGNGDVLLELARRDWD